jgi:hypothetical protein
MWQKERSGFRHNEKVLAKCGEFEELNVQEFTNVANAFSMKLN